MKFEILSKIQELEELIFKGYKLWIFRGYVAVNKRGVEKIIDDIYTTLPVDVHNARQYLNEHDSTSQNPTENSNIYEVLKDLEILINKGNLLPDITLLDQKKLKNIEERLKEAIPNEINKAAKK